MAPSVMRFKYNFISTRRIFRIKMDRSSHQRWSVRKGVLRNNFFTEHLWRLPQNGCRYRHVCDKIWQEIPRNVYFRELGKYELWNRNYEIFVVLKNWLATAKENSKLELIIQLRNYSLLREATNWAKDKSWRNT